jgi:hypothetical protein
LRTRISAAHAPSPCSRVHRLPYFEIHAMRLQNLVLPAILLASGLLPAASAQVRLFGVDGTNLVELDTATGAVISSIPLTGGPASTVGALTYERSTDTMFVSSTSFDNLWTLDYTTGALTLIGPYNVGTAVVMHGLEVDDTGQLYGYSFAVAVGARFFSIDRVTGQATPISDPGTGGFGSLGFVPATGTMYLGDTTLDQLLTIDRTTGATTVVGPYGPGAAAGAQIGIALAYHPQFGMYAVNNTGTDSLWSLDLASGTATLVANLTTGNLISLAFVGDPPPGTTFCPGDGSGTACPCANESAVGAGEGCLSSLGLGGRLRDNGIASLANDTVVLLGTNMPSSSALYFQGTTQQLGGAGATFGDGLRCVGGTIIRLGTTTNASGSSQYPFGVSPSVSVKGNVTTPGTRTYQVWYRNAAAFCTTSTFNLTNGRELSWTP